MWAICVASISWEICLSYLGKVFGNLDVVFVNSTGTSCRPKTNQVFLNLNQTKYICFFSSHLDKISVFVSSTFMEKDNTEPPIITTSRPIRLRMFPKVLADKIYTSNEFKKVKENFTVSGFIKHTHKLFRIV